MGKKFFGVGLTAVCLCVNSALADTRWTWSLSGNTNWWASAWQGSNRRPDLGSLVCSTVSDAHPF